MDANVGTKLGTYLSNHLPPACRPTFRALAKAGSQQIENSRMQQAFGDTHIIALLMTTLPTYRHYISVEARGTLLSKITRVGFAGNVDTLARHREGLLGNTIFELTKL